MPLACLMLLSYSKVPFLICSQCYKTFLLETLIYPFVKTTRLSHFKSNRQFNSVLLLENIIVMAFLCKFRHQNQLFDFLNFSGNLDFPQKSFTTPAWLHFQTKWWLRAEARCLATPMRPPSLQRAALAATRRSRSAWRSGRGRTTA